LIDDNPIWVGVLLHRKKVKDKRRLRAW
jgi:hypothetical protein